MGKKWMVAVFVFVLIIFGFSLRSIADCKSDCQDTYESAVESCKEQYDDPDDADMFKMCIDNAKSEYESCIGECENLDQGDSQETKNIFFCFDAPNPSLSFERVRPRGVGVKIDWATRLFNS